MVRFILLLAVSAMAQEIYENSTLNTRFEVPSGWVLDTPDTGSSGTVTLKTTRVGLQPVTMRASRLGSNEAGFHSAGSETFYRLSVLYKGTTSTQAPVVSFVDDTIIGPLHYTSLIVKQVDQNVVVVENAVSNQNFLHTFIYSTTLSDFNTNAALYGQNFSKFLFISLTGPAVKISAAPSKSQSESNAMVYDFLGRSKGRLMEVKPERQPRLFVPNQ